MLKMVKNDKPELIVRKIGAAEARIQNNKYIIPPIYMNNNKEFFVSYNIKKDNDYLFEKSKMHILIY